MAPDNPFDRRLENVKRMPDGMRDASILLTDTLDLCWAAAQAVFEKEAKPEHALALLPLFIERAAVERQRLLDELSARTEGGTSAPLGARRR